MPYIDAIKGSAVAFVIFVVLALVIPGGGLKDEVELVLMVSTFLFAILAGFFISRMSSRYDQIRQNGASEDALWLSFYNTAGFMGKRFKNKVAEYIDKYYIVTFDYEVGQSYKHNSKYVLALYDELAKLDISKDKIKESVFDELVLFLAQIEDKRNVGSIVEDEKLTKGQWAILIILAVIIVVSVYSIKTGSLYSGATAVLLSTVLVLVLFLVRDLQNFRLGGTIMLAESGQEVLEMIGKLRYYNQSYIKEGTVSIPKDVKAYRIGLHKPGEKLKIKTVKRK